MKSSRMYNGPQKVFAGINQQSVYFVVFTLVIGFSIIGLFSLAMSGLFVVLCVFVTVAASLFSYRFSESLIEGDFFFQGKENKKVEFLEKYKHWPVSVNFSETIEGKMIDFNNLKEIFNKNFSLGYDENSLYRLNKSSYDEMFGFDLSDYKIDSKHGDDFSSEYSIYHGDYGGEVEQMLRSLPPLAQIQVIRFSRLETSEEVKIYRPSLIEAKAQNVKYYLIVSLDSRFHGDGHKNTLVSIMNGFRRLSKVELNNYHEQITAPKTQPSGTGKNLATTEISLSYSEPYYDDYVVGAASLAMLPARIDEDFSSVYSSFKNLESTISLRYIKRREGRMVDVFKRITKQRKKDEGKASYADLQQIETEEKRTFKNDYANLLFDVNILLAGPKSEVQRGIEALQNFQFSSIDQHEAAKFIQLKGFVKEAINACFLGSKEIIHTRLHNIKSFKEATLYGIFPKSNSFNPKNFRLLMRNEDNAIESINLLSSLKSPFTLIFGPSGSGKSTLLNMFVRINDYVNNVVGIKTYTISNDIGSSLRWRYEDNKETSVAFELNKDELNNFLPFSTWPLRALMFDKGQSDGDITAARDYVCTLLGLDPEDDKQSGDTALITRSVKDLVESKKDLRLSNLFDILERNIDAFLNTRKEGSLKDSIEEAWRHRSANLYKFTKNGEFGGIFDAETSKDFEATKINFWYFNIDSADKQSKDLIGGFLSFAYALTFSLAARFGPKSKVVAPVDKKTLLLIDDETDWKKDYLQQTSLTNIPDQCRKFDIVPVLSFQQIQYINDLSDKIVKSVGRFFFYRTPADDALDSEVFSKLVPRDRLRKKLLKMGEHIEDEYNRKRVYSVGFYSDTGTLSRLFVDVERNYLWRESTHAGATYLRKIVADKGFSDKEASKILYELGPKYPPREKPRDKEIEEILEQIEKGIGGWPKK